MQEEKLFPIWATSVFLVFLSLIITIVKFDNAEPFVSSSVVEQTVIETKIEATVTELFTKETTYRKNYGYNIYAYGYDGYYGGDYIYIPDSKVITNTDYYVALTDKNGERSCYNVKPKDFPMFEEGKEIELKVVSYEPPSSAHSIEYFYGDAQIKLVEITNVEDNMGETD